MPPWQRRQSRGFFTTTAQRIWVSPGFVSIQDGILASLKTVKEVSHTVSPGLAYLQASRRRDSPVYQISSRKHIRSLPLLYLITPQFTKNLLSPYIVSCSADPITRSSSPITHVHHVLTIHVLIALPSTFTILHLRYCGCMLRPARVRMTRAFHSTCRRRI
jgi:hypothetical protein